MLCRASKQTFKGVSRCVKFVYHRLFCLFFSPLLSLSPSSFFPKMLDICSFTERSRIIQNKRHQLTLLTHYTKTDEVLILLTVAPSHLCFVSERVFCMEYVYVQPENNNKMYYYYETFYYDVLPASYTRAMNSSSSSSIFLALRVRATCAASPSMQLPSSMHRIATAARGRFLSPSIV